MADREAEVEALAEVKPTADRLSDAEYEQVRALALLICDAELDYIERQLRGEQPDATSTWYVARAVLASGLVTQAEARGAVRGSLDVLGDHVLAFFTPPGGGAGCEICSTPEHTAWLPCPPVMRAIHDLRSALIPPPINRTPGVAVRLPMPERSAE